MAGKRLTTTRQRVVAVAVISTMLGMAVVVWRVDWWPGDGPIGWYWTWLNVAAAVSWLVFQAWSLVRESRKGKSAGWLVAITCLGLWVQLAGLASLGILSVFFMELAHLDHPMLVVTVPVGVVFALPVGWLYRYCMQPRWRRERGMCVACGYDLRASPGRCPECGSMAEAGDKAGGGGSGGR